MRMENLDDMLKQLKNFSGGLHILEDEIPIDEQKEYFEYGKRFRDSFEDESCMYWIGHLFSPLSDVETKRRCLTALASMVNIAAYRAIETYHESPQEKELTNWSALALAESKILISSDLSEEKQVFISTGLGGHNGKLRFFVVIPALNNSDFSDFQCEMLEREFQFQFRHLQIDLEDFEICKKYLKMVILSGLDIDLKKGLLAIIEECNQYGHFLGQNYLLTNMRKFEDTEIIKLLNKKNNIT